MATLAINLGGQFAAKLIMPLLAAHDKRLAEAKAENSAVNAALSALVHDCEVITDSFNKGFISSSIAIQSCVDVDAWYWQYIRPYTQYKNASPSQCTPFQLLDARKLSVQGGGCFQSTQVTSNTFTAASYMGCNVVDAALGNLRAALISLQNAKPGTTKKVSVCGWPANKYGLTPFAGEVLTLTVPSAENPEEVTLSSAGILSVGAAPTSNSVVVAQGAVVGQSGFGLGLGSISPTLLLVGGAAILFALTLSGRK
jgi:hypothetical protein